MPRLATGSKAPFPHHEGRHLFVVVEWVFGDEAGIDDGSPYCIVGGYRASHIQWRRFDKEWNEVVLSPQFKTDKGFHAVDFHNRHLASDPEKNPYANWSEKRARDYIAALTKVIRTRKIDVVAGVVNVADFKSFEWGEQCALVNYEPGVSVPNVDDPAPYHLAFRLMVEESINNVPQTTEIHFRMDQQRELQQRAVDGFDWTKRWGLGGGVPNLGDLQFTKQEKSPGVQAADLLVSEWLATLRYGPNLSTERRAVMDALTHKRDWLWDCDRPAMERMLAMLPPSHRDFVRTRPVPDNTP